MSVLNDSTYEKDIPSRRAMYPYEEQLLTSCLEYLSLTREDYVDQIRRCGPLSESTKQSLEINEEDHGKAIMIFTIVTIIFLPLSFVTSYLGMNTSDIRDMESRQSLFWSIAIPLTAVTMGSILFISYNGDELRDTIGATYRTLTGKQDRATTARGISVAQRKRARNLANATDTLDYGSLADEAEYMDPRADGRPLPYNPPEIDDELDTRMLYPAKRLTAVAYNAGRAGSASPPPAPQHEAAMIPPVKAIRKTTLAPPPPPPPRQERDDAAYARDAYTRSTRPTRPAPPSGTRLAYPIPSTAYYAPPAPHYMPPAPTYPRLAQPARSHAYRSRVDDTRRYDDEWGYYPPPPPPPPVPVYNDVNGDARDDDMPRYDWARKRHARDEHRRGRREDYPRR
jgi:hypothetical protein